jgi:hypothetical protein
MVLSADAISNDLAESLSCSLFNIVFFLCPMACVRFVHEKWILVIFSCGTLP